MKRTADLGQSTLGELREQLQELSNAGAPPESVVRVRTRASFNRDGALVRAVTATSPRRDD